MNWSRPTGYEVNREIFDLILCNVHLKNLSMTYLTRLLKQLSRTRFQTNVQTEQI